MGAEVQKPLATVVIWGPDKCDLAHVLLALSSRFASAGAGAAPGRPPDLPASSNRPQDDLRACYALAVLLTSASGAWAQQASVKVVGIGSGSCREFLQEVRGNPATERDYIGWAQGYMSGLLIRAPAWVDENLDLLPPTFPLQKQGDFLHAFCSRAGDAAFTDAVQGLYRPVSRRRPGAARGVPNAGRANSRRKRRAGAPGPRSP